MRAILNTIIWPSIAGILAATLILDRWILNEPLLHPATDGPDSYRTVVARATPSVVNIYTAKLVTQRSRFQNDPLRRRFQRTAPTRQRLERALGSGVIMTTDGHIITNYHVIADAELIEILLYDGRTARAVVVGSDRETDLAILKVDLDNLIPIDVADSDRISVGDVVLSIGNPYGFGHSVSQGIVSGLGRGGLQLSVYEDYIQTDAAIHLGSSGGALVNTRGELIGINTLIVTANGEDGQDTSSIGINLATPSNLASFVMDDLIRFGKVVRGWLGVNADLSVMRAEDGSLSRRLVVTEMAQGGPAQRAGMRANDIIVSLNGEVIGDGQIAMHRIARLRPGEVVTVGVERDGNSIELQTIVGTRPGIAGQG